MKNTKSGPKFFRLRQDEVDTKNDLQCDPNFETLERMVRGVITSRAQVWTDEDLREDRCTIPGPASALWRWLGSPHPILDTGPLSIPDVEAILRSRAASQRDALGVSWDDLINHWRHASGAPGSDAGFPTESLREICRDGDAILGKLTDQEWWSTIEDTIMQSAGNLEGGWSMNWGDICTTFVTAMAVLSVRAECAHYASCLNTSNSDREPLTAGDAEILLKRLQRTSNYYPGSPQSDALSEWIDQQDISSSRRTSLKQHATDAMAIFELHERVQLAWAWLPNLEDNYFGELRKRNKLSADLARKVLTLTSCDCPATSVRDMPVESDQLTFPIRSGNHDDPSPQ